MAMLAETRRKQKWTLNPRGKHWSDDSNKFGQKMLEKMGWSSGKGLGANLDGMTEHVRLKYKDDQAGIGFSHADRDKQWTQHQEGFNELLQQLHSGEAASTTVVETELSGKSLELKSKQSRARVHYQKFTRGKDVNKYSAKDLANIFGKKSLDEKSQEAENVKAIENDPAEISAEPIGSCDASHGVVTIKGGSISDYFKTKMAVLGRKTTNEIPQDSESEPETRVGFGFSAVPKKSETPDFSFANPSLNVTNPNEKKTTPGNRKNEFAFENPCLEIASPKSATETPRKRKNEFAFENPCLEIASPKNAAETPRKRKNDFAFDNPGLETVDVPTDETQTPKRRKSEFAFENGGLDVDYTRNGGAPAAISCNDDAAKKKRKKRAKECIPPPTNGIINEALNLDSRNDEISVSGQFEVPRLCFGLANDGLDLTDETNGRKRVTFNDAVEYETDVASAKRKKKKNKNAGKLDKFEVDNEKMRRKKKKSRINEIGESAFVNPAMDVEASSQEANENAENERKSARARKKRNRGIPRLETITEIPDEESVVEVVTLDESLVGDAKEDLKVLSREASRRGRKKNRENPEVVEIVENVDLETTIDISEEDVEVVEEISRDANDNDESSKKKKKKKTKKNKKIREDDGSAVGNKNETKNSAANDEESMEIVDSEKPKKERTKKNSATDNSKENVNTENVGYVAENSEDAESAKKRKKRKKEKKNGDREDGGGENQADEKKSTEERLENGGQSPWEAKVQKSKKSFKALFARSPIVNFVGSNINEIKGYGMDLK